MASEVRRKHYYRERVALFMVTGLLLLFALWLWLTAFPINGAPQRFHVLFHNVNGLHKNAAVYIDGVRVGTIEDVKLKGPKQVLVSVMVNQHDVRVPDGSQFHIRANGIVGAKYLDVELPDEIAGLPMLTDKSTAQGVDPIPTEILMEQVEDRLAQLDPAAIQQSIDHIRIAADNVSVLSKKLNPVADRAASVEDNVSLLATDLRQTTNHFNRVFRDKKFSSNLHSVADTARDASVHLDTAMARLQAVTGDKESRQDVVDALSKLDDASQNVRAAVCKIDQLGSNQELRSDAKQIVSNAKDTVEKVDKLVSDPGFGLNVKATLNDAREAFERMALVGEQLNQILDKRAPLLQMLMGRPGHLNRPAGIAGQQKCVE